MDVIAEATETKGGIEHTVEVGGDDWADLMVNWLRELLYLWNGEEQLVCAIAVEFLDRNHLRARVATTDYSPDIHSIRNEIKAVTYHQIQVGPHESGWRAQVIFDI